jgi:chromosomal replication initiator protein
MTTQDIFAISPVTFCHVPEKLPRLKKPKIKIVMADKVIPVITSFYGVDLEELEHKTRKREIVMARQVAMFMIYKFCQLSSTDIGKLFGGRDHTTVFHSRKTVQDLMDTDQRYWLQIQEIERQIRQL